MSPKSPRVLLYESPAIGGVEGAKGNVMSLRILILGSLLLFGTLIIQGPLVQVYNRTRASLKANMAEETASANKAYFEYACHPDASLSALPSNYTLVPCACTHPVLSILMSLRLWRRLGDIYVAVSKVAHVPRRRARELPNDEGRRHQGPYPSRFYLHLVNEGG